MSLFNQLNNLMAKYHFRPNKKFGQHFIIDGNIIDKIVSAAELKPEDIVLEVGAGTGFLSQKMAEKCLVYGFEIDEALNELLENEFKENENFKLVKENFLKAKLPAFNKIVCCPPYHSSSDIMFKLFGLEFELAVLVFQKDFVEKMLSLPGFPDYTALSVLTAYFFEAEVLGDVHSKCFFPAPKTFSRIIKLKSVKRFGQAKNDHDFVLFLKEIFRFKNKNLSNALGHALPFLEKEINLKKDKALKALAESGLADKKVYCLECQELVGLFNNLAN